RRSSRITGRPRACFEPTIVVSSPSTSSFAPTANSSRVSLASSTTKEPSSPCDLPTRPMTTESGLLTRELLEELRRLLRRRLRPLARPLGQVRCLAPGVAQLHVRSVEKGPIRAGLVFVRHADAARIHQPNVADVPVELKMRMCSQHDSR